MRFDIITLFPEMLSALDVGITGRAHKNQHITINTWNPRDFAEHSDRRIDDRPYGGGPGMVMQYEPLHRTIQAVKATQSKPSKVIYLSPQGTPLTQAAIRQFANQSDPLILLAGRYEGIDERLLTTDIDEEWSVGDYVLSGGELPAMLLIDAITRLLPNVLGDPESAQQDSFGDDGLLDHPHYTRPAQINGMNVPAVLQSGDHAAINKWRHAQKLRKTWQKRPDLLKRRVLTDDEKQLMEMYIKESAEGKGKLA